MNRILLKKSFGDARWLLLALVLLLFSFSWIRVWLVSTLEMPRFASIVKPLFDKWGQFSPVTLDQLLSYPGRIALTFAEPIIVFGMTLWAIGRGSDCVSGEIGRGTMEMLLAQPVARWQIFWSQASVTIGGTAVLALVVWLGIYTGIHTNRVELTHTKSLPLPLTNLRIPLPFLKPEKEIVPMIDVVQPRQMIAPTVNLFAYGFCIAGLASLFSSWDRYRWRTIGLMTGLFTIQFMIKVLALSSKHLLWLKQFSFLTAYEPQRFVAAAVDSPQDLWAWTVVNHQDKVVAGLLTYNVILLGIGLVSYLLATVIFCRRDLPAPL